MRINKELKVGIFAIGTIAMFYLGFNYLKGIDFFSRTDRYYVIYDNVGGLLKSNPVKISGFNVGRVADIDLIQGEISRVVVALDIDKDIILGDSSTAILDVSLLGDVAIVISVGKISNPIDPGDTLFARSDPGLTQMLVESTAPITDNLPATIANLNDRLIQLEGIGDTIKYSLHKFNLAAEEITYFISTNKDTLEYGINNFTTLSKSLKESVEEIKPMLQKYSALADSLNNVNLAETVNKLNSLLAEVSIATEALNSSEGTLGKMIYEDSLYTNLNQALLSLDSLLININDNPKHFFSPLGKSRKKIEKDRAKQLQE